MSITDTGRVKRRVSDKLIDLQCELETLKYRRGRIKANIVKYQKAGDTKNASIYQNRYNDLVELEKEIKAEIFAETDRLFNGY